LLVYEYVTEDTYLGSKADPLSLNLYVYCRNNPLIYWDPTGHKDAYVYNRYGEIIGTSTTGSSYTDYSTAATNTVGGYPLGYTGEQVYQPWSGGNSSSGGSSSSSSSSNSSSGSTNSGSGGGGIPSGTTGWTDQQYYDYAQSVGMNKEATGLFDVIDSLLTTDKGFNSVKNIQIYTGSKMNHNQTTGITSITYANENGNSQTISTQNNDFFISNEGLFIFNNKAAAKQMNHESNDTFTAIEDGDVSYLVPTSVVESIREAVARVLSPTPTMSASMITVSVGVFAKTGKTDSTVFDVYKDLIPLIPAIVVVKLTKDLKDIAKWASEIIKSATVKDTGIISAKTLEDIAKDYPIGKCFEAADAMTKEIIKRKQQGEMIIINYSGVSGLDNNYVISLTYPSEAISYNGNHVGVLYNELVHCNIHPYGLPEKEWLSDFVGEGIRTVTRIPIIP